MFLIKSSSAQVVTRGQHSLGYGFIVYQNETDAAEAVKQLANTEFQERTLKVQLAAQQKKRTPFKKHEKLEAEEKPVGKEENGETPSQAAKPKRKNRKPKNKKIQDQATENQQEKIEPKEKKEKVIREAASGEKNSEDKASRRNNRPPRQERFLLNGSTIFVGNLPFNLFSDDLKTYFEETLHFKIDSVFVSRRGYISKGFGFIKFANEEEFHKCLDKYEQEELVIGERVIRIRIAEEHGDQNE